MTKPTPPTKRWPRPIPKRISKKRNEFKLRSPSAKPSGPPKSFSSSTTYDKLRSKQFLKEYTDHHHHNTMSICTLPDITFFTHTNYIHTHTHTPHSHSFIITLLHIHCITLEHFIAFSMLTNETSWLVRTS